MLSPTVPDSEHITPVPPVSVLVVDDQLAVREGLARLFACAPISFRGIHTAANRAEAIRIALWLQPEVVVLDVDLAGDDGLSLIGHFGPAAGVLVLSCHGDMGTRARAARLGALAFVEKHQPAAELLAALVAVASVKSRGEKCPAGAGELSCPETVASSAAPRGYRP